MHEEIWIQTEINNNNSTTNDQESLNTTMNEVDIIPLTPPGSSPLDTEKPEPNDAMVIEKELSDAVESTKITVEIPTTTIKLEDIIVEKPNEVITLSETVTLGSSTQPDKPQETNIKLVYPIPPIVPQKQEEKPLEFSKMPNYAVPSVPKPSFSVLRTKSGEVIPRYVDSSKAPEKPNYVIPKSTPTKTFPLLRTNSSEKLVPKPNDKHATSPLSKVHVLTKSGSFQRTNSSENLLKSTSARNTPTKTLSRETPPKSTPLHRTKSNENIAKTGEVTTQAASPKSTPLHRTKSNENITKMDTSDKTKTDNADKPDKTTPKKPLQSKSIATILRTISSDNLKNENPYKRKLSDAASQPKDDAKPKSGDLASIKEESKTPESVPTKSPTYIYPKPPAQSKSPAKSPAKSPIYYSYPPLSASKSPTTNASSPTSSSKSPTYSWKSSSSKSPASPISSSSKSPTSNAKSPSTSPSKLIAEESVTSNFQHRTT